MRKFYQTTWFGIDFKPLGGLSSKAIADEEFYSKFYKEFYKRFSSYDDLSKEWKDGKKMVADLIASNTGDGERLLSIGCGSGYVEYLLGQMDRDVTAIEPSEYATKFLQDGGGVKLYHGYFPECLSSEGEKDEFDYAFMIGTEYALEDAELIKLLSEARKYPLKNFLLVCCSVDSGSFLRKAVSTAAGIVKNVLSAVGLYDRGQLWGYLRTPGELERIFKSAGFIIKETGIMNEQIFYVKGGIDK